MVPGQTFEATIEAIKRKEQRAELRDQEESDIDTSEESAERRKNRKVARRHSAVV